MVTYLEIEESKVILWAAAFLLAPMAAATLGPAPQAQWLPPSLPSEPAAELDARQDEGSPDMAMWPLIPLSEVPRIGTAWLERSRLELQVLATVASDATPAAGDVRPAVALLLYMHT